jgi:hypothetical protein
MIRKSLTLQDSNSKTENLLMRGTTMQTSKQGNPTSNNELKLFSTIEADNEVDSDDMTRDIADENFHM